ncbi:type IV pili twitching motility protein PilT [Candidatus Beckwithbacteria bacterium CG22_combo_CG10-13_8_21_14_all_01_47_9]|uniref:Type IV pili twitching motility protein PilT n=4 Tax=Candidatus Beckwithiibacteriota TaxID=1752726 RepID=A0A2H0E1F0_9BACT|nr:MAG: type IV pili twitching motility protein PilT [Candidatus Beckwithbacteria bacterium CG1_02_47_37]PIP88262.1 MAG: type IV pili twitching motility protein PilT [Candidatus Beckwithbacteria bacterium CG22_combo_CG10-13_8_21_14_all_01_47_9]PJA22477.1 MAG: type IV pili twitching motility protein PilT [Candidatus Beckwithbacteria bacterium CG_4_10_14_0_2_um_filter_47_25]PJC66342.1 MAG: type IV pili twitching motility protein PilT [Candidatus Beckwithbacteria bacterium CG_4_9_14_0_2_um_filter_4
MTDIKHLLKTMIDRQASDLHLLVGSPAYLRVDGILKPFDDGAALTRPIAKELIFPLLTQSQKDVFLVNKELDFSVELGNLGRFRVNVYWQKGTMAAALRLITSKIRTVQELKLPKICSQLAELKQGLVLVTGPTGHGKSTTLAAIIEQINQSRAEHILTIEDPIEYVYTPVKSIVSQREMHGDTHSWAVALRSALREDPNVVLVGEMRDFETIAAALTVAETGHLVLATLHTNNAAQTIDRIVDVFPEHQQGQIRVQLANTLTAVLSQRLIPAIGGGRVAAMEILLGTTAVKTSIREGKSHMIGNVIQTSAELGMQSLEQDLAHLVKSKTIELSVGSDYALSPLEFNRLVNK